MTLNLLDFLGRARTLIARGENRQGTIDALLALKGKNPKKHAGALA
jgi:hypothetical protein